MAVPALSPGGIIAILRINAAVQIWRTSSTNPVRVTDDADLDGYPSVSLDGQWLAFNRWNGGRRDLFVKDLVNGSVTALETSSHQKQFPLISPKGGAVAYGVAERSKRAVFMQTRTGSGPPRICETCTQPVKWVDEGGHLLVTSGTPAALHLLEVQTGQMRLVLMSPTDEDIEDADWDSTTERICFTVSGRQGTKRLFVASLPRSTWNVGDWVALTEAKEWSVRPRWSEDGRWVYFASTRDGFRCLWRISLRADSPPGPPEAVEHFHNMRFTPARLTLAAFNLSVGGGSVYFSSSQSTSSVWVSVPKE